MSDFLDLQGAKDLNTDAIHIGAVANSKDPVTGAAIDTHTNRVGGTDYTMQGFWNAIGPVVMPWTSVSGGTLTQPNQAFLHPANGNYYSWGGAFPHVVAPGTDPASVTGYVPRTDAVLRNDITNNGPLTYRFTKIALRDLVSVADHPDVDLTGSSDSTSALNSIIASGAKGLFIPAGVNVRVEGVVQFPNTSFTVAGMGAGSIVTFSATGSFKYSESNIEPGWSEITWIASRVTSLRIILEAGATGIDANGAWNAVGKSAHIVDRNSFILRGGANSATTKCIRAQGIWALHIEGNTAVYTGSLNPRLGGTGYFFYAQPGDTTADSVMNVHISNNETAYVSYPVFAAPRTVQSGGRCEGIHTTNNNFLIGATGVDVTQATSCNTSMNQISDFTNGVIYRGCFLSNINDNTEVLTSGECIILTSIAESLSTAINVEGNICGNTGSTSGTSVPCILVHNQSTTVTNSINIGGNLLQGPAGTTYGTGVKFTGAYAFTSINVFSNIFKYVKYGIDLAMTDAGAVNGANTIHHIGNTYPSNSTTNITNRAWLYRNNPFHYPVSMSVTFAATATPQTSFQVAVSAASFDSAPIYGTLTGVMSDGKIAIGVVNPTSGSNTSTNAYVTWNVIGAATIPSGTFTASGYIAGYSKLTD